jgi:hypothetical protein
MSPQPFQDPHHLVIWAIVIIVAFLIIRRVTTHPVSFQARKKVSTPVKFTTSDGEKVSFRARKSKRVDVSFRARNK